MFQTEVATISNYKVWITVDLVNQNVILIIIIFQSMQYKA